MKKSFCTILMTFVALLLSSVACFAQDSGSNRKERNYITEGNKLYNDGRYRAALNKYQEALRENPSSAVARYNLGLAQIRLGTNPSDTTATAKQFLANGVKAMEEIAALGKEKPNLAARANYNLGNVAFNSEDYSKALGLYKQALRFNPADDSARRNLRITQLKLQNQNNDNNQDQNKDQNQDQQKQDQNKDQNKDQNQDQNKDQNKEKNQQQNQQQDINQQTADQILKAMENKENQTRARVAGQQGDKSSGKNRSRKNW